MTESAPNATADTDDNVPVSEALPPSAGLWRRFAALLYDAFLVAAIWMAGSGHLVTSIVDPNFRTVN